MGTKSKKEEIVQRQVQEVVLRFLEGENEGVEIRVNPPREMFMGRSEECDIFLGEKKISRKHCKLVVGPNSVRLEDFQSTNGTFVNGKKVSEVELESEDKVKVGTTIIQVSIAWETSIAETSAHLDEEPQAPKEEEPVAAPAEFELLASDEPSGEAEIPKSESFSFEEDSKISEPPVVQSSKPKTLSGNLSAMGLADLLQTFSQNQKSGILQLHSTREGKIWIVSGRILGAEVGRATGNKALFRLLSWNEGTFELVPLPPNFQEKDVKNTIRESIESLLMEGFRQFDEFEKIRKSLPPLTAKIKMKPKFSAPLSKLHPRVLDVLQIILNEGVFEKVLDESALSDLETSKVVFYLMKKDYVVVDS